MVFNKFCYIKAILIDLSMMVTLIREIENQIRRSSYNEAVKTTDIYKHVDILGIQTYVINSSTVVFLNKRARTQPKRNNRVGKCYSSDSLCRICERNLVDTSFFCSLACKVHSFLVFIFLFVTLCHIFHCCFMSFFILLFFY